LNRPPKVGGWYNDYTNSKLKEVFFVRLTMKQKLEMIEEHEINGLSISHAREKYGNYDVSAFKYLLVLYRRYGREFFIDRGITKYQRDTKLLAINRVLSGESIRQVALDFKVIDPSIVGDWVRKYKRDGETAIKDTVSRRNYLSKNERAKAIVDKTLLEENERLKAEIEYLKKSQSLTQNLNSITNKQKAVIITELRTSFKLKLLLDVCNMSESTYYYHTSKNECINKYQDIEDQITYLFLRKHKKRMGYQRIYIELKNLGYSISKKKVLEIMNYKGYIKKKKKKWRKYNSYQGDVGRVHPNLMEQDFTTMTPYEKAGTDVTMFPINGERIYLSPILDFHTREVLAYSVGEDAKMDKVMAMLDELKEKHKTNISDMMIQSDQGVQYQNSRYQDRLKELNVIQSMSRKANCLDNSPTENFFGRMKEEMWYGHENEYKTTLELIDAIEEYIEYYNNIRIVTRLKMSPIEYRNMCFSTSF